MDRLPEPLITELFEKRDVLAMMVMVPGEVHMTSPVIGFTKEGDTKFMVFMGIHDRAKLRGAFISHIGVIKDNHDTKEDMMALKGIFLRLRQSKIIYETSIWVATINPYYINYTQYDRTAEEMAKLRQFKYEDCKSYGDELLEEFRSIPKDPIILGNF